MLTLTWLEKKIWLDRLVTHILEEHSPPAGDLSPSPLSGTLFYQSILLNFLYFLHQYKDNLVTDIDIVSITLKSSFFHIVFKFRVEDAVDVEVKMETWNHFKRKLELLEYNQIRPNEQCIIIWWTLYIIWPSNHHLQVYHNLVFHYYKIIHHYNFNQYNYYHNHYTLYKVMSLPWIFASTMVSCRQNKVQCIL